MEQNYHCPDFFIGLKVYEILSHYKGYAPYIFNPGVNIYSAFGSIPGMTWNGGTVISPGQLHISEIQFIFERYRQLGIKVNLTLTNPLLEKEDCYDRYCNTILGMADNGINSAIVTSPYLEEHIRKNFPNIGIIKSIVSTKNDEDYLSMLDDYEMIVLPRRLICDMDYLKTIPVDKRDKFEFLCNDPCPKDCPYLYSHYNAFAKLTLFQENDDNQNFFDNRIRCQMLDGVFPQLRYVEDRIPPEKISEYTDLGFSHFKLSGRATKSGPPFSVVPYLIKPEYQIPMLRVICDSLM